MSNVKFHCIEDSEDYINVHDQGYVFGMGNLTIGITNSSNPDAGGRPTLGVVRLNYATAKEFANEILTILGDKA